MSGEEEIPFKERNQNPPPDTNETGTQETSFTENNEFENLDPDPKNNETTNRPPRPSDPVGDFDKTVPEDEVESPHDTSIPVGIGGGMKWAEDYRESLLSDQGYANARNFLHENQNATLFRDVGPNSQILFDNFTVKIIDGKVVGASFKGKKIFVLSSTKKNVIYSSNQKVLPAVDEFKVLLEKAKNENSQTAGSVVSEETTFSNLDATVQSVEMTMDDIQEEMNDMVKKIENLEAKLNEREKTERIFETTLNDIENKVTHIEETGRARDFTALSQGTIQEKIQERLGELKRTVEKYKKENETVDELKNQVSSQQNERITKLEKLSSEKEKTDELKNQASSQQNERITKLEKLLSEKGKTKTKKERTGADVNEDYKLDIAGHDVREAIAAINLGPLRQNMPDVDRIISLTNNIEHWKQIIEEYKDDPTAKDFFEGAMKTEELERDYIFLRNGMKPIMEDNVEKLKSKARESDYTRLEKFKKFVKENAVGGSALLISTAGFITGIIAATRKAITAGARGLGKFGSAVAKVLKKLGPLFSAIGSLVSTVLSMGAKGISWLANNLWLLAIAIAVAIYQEYRNKKRNKS